MNYIDPQNHLHNIDDAAFAYLLPAGSVPISDAEAGVLRQAAIAAAPAPVPNIVTMRQARLALLAAGLLPAVNAAVAAMPGAEGDAARIEWEFSGTVERNWPLVEALAVALNLTEQQLDDLFVAAAAL